MVNADGDVPALVIACSATQDLKADGYREFFAWHCAEQIVAQLNDERAGFDGPEGFVRLQPADIAADMYLGRPDSGI